MKLNKNSILNFLISLFVLLCFSISNADEYTNGTYPNDTESDDEGFKDVRK